MSRSPLFDIYDPYGTLSEQLQFGSLPTDGDGFEPIGLVPVKRQPTISDLMPEEEKKGMLRGLSEMGASGLTGLGWLLDIPGTLVRGTVAGLADGDPLRGVREVGMSSDQRTSGRDLLRKFGVVGQEDNWQNYATGIAAEMAMDPLTYLNPLAILGRGAYGAAGRAAARAGLLDEAALQANKAGVGIREYLRRTPRELIGRSDDAATRFRQAVEAKGLNYEDLLDQPLAGLAEARIPGTEAGVLLGTGGIGDSVAKALDSFGEDFLKRSPYVAPVVNRLTASFDPSVMGEIDPAKQWRNREAFATAKANRRDSLEWLASRQAAADQVTHNGFKFSSPRIQNAIRDTIEAQRDPARMAQLLDAEAVSALEAVPEWRKFRDDIADRLAEEQASASQYGLELPVAATNEGTGYFPSQRVWFSAPQEPDIPRHVRSKQSQYNRGPRLLNIDDLVGRSRDPKTDLAQRSETFRRLMGGEFGRNLQDRLINAADESVPGIMDEAFASLGLDPAYSGMREQGFTAKGINDMLAAASPLTPEARERYEKALEVLTGRQSELKKQLGDTLRLADRQFSTNNMGLFDGSAVNDMARYLSGRATATANAPVIIDELIKNASRTPAQSMIGGGSVSLLEGAKELGFSPAALESLLRNKMGFGVDVPQLSVGRDVIADLKRLSPVNQQQEPGMLGRLWNSYTNSFKVGALANPAYHTRNLYSGFASTLSGGSGNIGSNLLDWIAGYGAGGGNYDQRLLGIFPSLYERIKDAPQFKNLDKEQVLAKFKAEAARNRLGGGQITDIEGPVEQATRALYPGGDSADPIRYYDANRSWPEWATVRGVDFSGVAGDRPPPSETLNPLLQLHERVGQGVENANRLGTYIAQLRQGASPDAAADMVLKTQVDYSPQAFTQFERQLKKYVPFYSYPRGIAPLVAENILYRPGGLQSQSIRAVSRGSEPNEDFFTPEYLRQTAAIPLTESLGGKPADNLQRFVTNIDAPWDGLINLVSPGIGNTPLQAAIDGAQKTGMNLLGQINPIIKAPLEMVLNRQLYTGRELSDLYSFLEARVDPQYGPLARMAEQIVVNSPGGAKLTSIARTLLDGRLSWGQKATKLGINNTLGLHVTDVDQERTRRLAAREQLNELLSTVPGVRTYENITVPPEVLQAMPQEQQRMYLLYKVIQSEAAKRARDKKKQQMALDPLQLLGAVNQF